MIDHNNGPLARAKPEDELLKLWSAGDFEGLFKKLKELGPEGMQTALGNSPQLARALNAGLSNTA